jgi:aspartate carbamoyltransferase
MNGAFQGKNFISIDQFNREDIDTLLDLASTMELAILENNVPQLMRGKVFKAIMFEDSTRTAGSFNTAALRLGALVQQPNLGASSMSKGESAIETVRCFAGQSDGLLIRHADQDFMDEVATRTKTPFMNGGNGRQDHPTQTFIDLYTLKKLYGKLDGLKIVLAGDVANNRPARSFLKAAGMYGMDVVIAAPKFARMPADVIKKARALGATITETVDLRPLLKQPRIIYLSRSRKEYGTEAENKRMGKAYVDNGYRISHETMINAHPEVRIIHALPHGPEISEDFYTDPRAYYFEQEDNGIPVRMSCLALQHAQDQLQAHDMDTNFNRAVQQNKSTLLLSSELVRA